MTGSRERERVLTAKIMGAAGRFAAERPVDLEQAVAEVRALAGDRSDLLAEAAGTYLGTVQVDAHHWYYPLAAQICMDAGADWNLIPGFVEEARKRAARTWSGIVKPHGSVRPGES